MRSDGSLGVSKQHNGRGAWLCRDSSECMLKAVRRNAFSRAFKRSIKPETIDKFCLELSGIEFS